MLLNVAMSSAGSSVFAVLGLLLSVGMLVLTGFFFYWVVKFVVFVPKYLKRIAEALETNKEKMGEQ